MTTRPLQPTDKQDAARIAASVAALAEIVYLAFGPHTREGHQAKTIADEVGAMSKRLWPES